MPHYLAAREGNAQSRNTFHLCQKMGDRTPGGFACPIPTSMGPIFAGMGQVISGFQTNRLGSRCGTNAKLLHGVIGLISISSLAVKLLLESIHCLIFLGEIAVHIQRYSCYCSHPCHSMNLWRKLTGKWLSTNPDDIKNKIV